MSKYEIEIDEINDKYIKEAFEHYNLNNKNISFEEFLRINLMDSIHDYRVSKNLDYSINYP